jgi:hypothetical protein
MTCLGVMVLASRPFQTDSTFVEHAADFPRLLTLRRDVDTHELIDQSLDAVGVGSADGGGCSGRGGCESSIAWINPALDVTASGNRRSSRIGEPSARI